MNTVILLIAAIGIIDLIEFIVLLIVVSRNKWKIRNAINRYINLIVAERVSAEMERRRREEEEEARREEEELNAKRLIASLFGSLSNRFGW